MIKKFLSKPFISARDEAEELKTHKYTPQTASSSYKLAFLDQDFLLREELRPVRLQLELLKPEMVQQELGIEETIVVFGSARIGDKKYGQEQVEIAKKALIDDPSDPVLIQKVRVAESLLAKAKYYDEARELGKIISNACKAKEELNYVVITGGGPGIMEAANRGCHDAKAKSIGVSIVLPKEEAPNPYVTPELTFKFHYFAIRKMHFLMRARALVAFPGGFGTLDELFETLTLMQTRKIRKVPILLFGKAFWDRIFNLDAMVEEGVISPGDVDLVRYVETAQEAWDVILKFYQQD